MIKDIDKILKDIKFINDGTSEIMKSYKLKTLTETIPFEEKEKIVRELISDLQQKIIPYEYPKFIFETGSFFLLRDLIIREQGFAVVCKKWIKPLAEWIGKRKCLEVMAGCGSISYALQQEGVNIIATDNFSWDGHNSWNSTKKYFTDIENIDCVKAVEKYGKDIDIIIMSWAYMDDNAYKTLIKMREINPSAIMIVIGEGQGGCTANDDFFEEINIIKDEKINYINCLYETWDGLYDFIMLVN